MTNVEVIHQTDSGMKETTIYNPDFVDVLLNLGEVSVDGRVFTDVKKVKYRND
jgi:hypothetical protein